MPQAGEYKEQLLSIEILSKLAYELGFYIYVKEHWVQVHRDKDYYKRISELPNVMLVKMNTNSIELINNSIAVSTQTGNVIFESLINKKPVIVYSSGYLFKGAPNVVEMESYYQLKEIMKKILNSEYRIEELYKKLVLAHTHGITHDEDMMEGAPHEGPWYYEEISLGYNYRITDFQAALITSQMTKLDKFAARRKEIVKMMDCDLCITAGGTTLYELCACGTPSLMYILADNQMDAAKKFNDTQLIPCLGDARVGFDEFCEFFVLLS